MARRPDRRGRGAPRQGHPVQPRARGLRGGGGRRRRRGPGPPHRAGTGPPLDLVILDVMLPGIDGFAVADADAQGGQLHAHPDAHRQEPARGRGARPGGGRRRLPAQALRPARAAGAGEGPAAPARLGARRRRARRRPRASARPRWTSGPSRSGPAGEVLPPHPAGGDAPEAAGAERRAAWSPRARSWRRSGTSAPTPRPARWTTSSCACAATSSDNPRFPKHLQTVRGAGYRLVLLSAAATPAGGVTPGPRRPSNPSAPSPG